MLFIDRFRGCKGQGCAPKLETGWKLKLGDVRHLFIRNCGFFTESIRFH